MTIEEFASAYEAATAEFLQIARSVPAEKLDLNDGENWSSRQVIHHCADSETPGSTPCSAGLRPTPVTPTITQNKSKKT